MVLLFQGRDFRDQVREFPLGLLQSGPGQHCQLSVRLRPLGTTVNDPLELIHAGVGVGRQGRGEARTGER